MFFPYSYIIDCINECKPVDTRYPYLSAWAIEENLYVEEDVVKSQYISELYY